MLIDNTVTTHTRHKYGDDYIDQYRGEIIILLLESVASNAYIKPKTIESSLPRFQHSGTKNRFWAGLLKERTAICL